MNVICKHHRNTCNKPQFWQSDTGNFKNKGLKNGKNTHFSTANNKWTRKEIELCFVSVLAGEKVTSPEKSEVI